MWSEPLQTYSMQVVGDLASAELRPASPLLPPSQLRDSPTFEAFVPVSYHPQYLLPTTHDTQPRSYLSYPSPTSPLLTTLRPKRHPLSRPHCRAKDFIQNHHDDKALHQEQSTLLMTSSCGSDYDDRTSTTDFGRRSSANSHSSIATSHYDEGVMYADYNMPMEREDAMVHGGAISHDYQLAQGAPSKRRREELPLKGQGVSRMVHDVIEGRGNGRGWSDMAAGDQNKRPRTSAHPSVLAPHPMSEPQLDYYHHPSHLSNISSLHRSHSMTVARTLQYEPEAAPAPHRRLSRSLSFDGVLPATRYPAAQQPASPTRPVILKTFTLPANPARRKESASPRVESAVRFERRPQEGYSFPSTPRKVYDDLSSIHRTPQQLSGYSPISPQHFATAQASTQHSGTFYPPPSAPTSSLSYHQYVTPAAASSTSALPLPPLPSPVAPERLSHSTARQQAIAARHRSSFPAKAVNKPIPSLPTLPGRRPPAAVSAIAPPPVRSRSGSIVSLSESIHAGPVEAVHPRYSSPAPVSRNGEAGKSHSCDFQGCGKTFRRFEHLKRHVRSHTSEKPYGCDTCGKWFSRSDNLAQHKKIHNKDVDEQAAP